MNPSIQATTILCVRRKNKVAIAGDGQVTLGDTVIKHGAKKIRRLYNDKIIAGFGSSPGLPARLRTPLPCSHASKRSSNSFTET